MYQKRLRGYKNLGYKLKQKIADDKLEYKNSEIYLLDTYEKVFLRDFTNSIKTITISAPAIAFNKLRNLTNIIGQLVSDGVTVTFIISNLKMDEYNFTEKMRLLKQLGVKVILKDNVTQKAAVLDQKIVWYGNINFIGNSNKDDCSLRIYSDDVAQVVELNLIRRP